MHVSFGKPAMLALGIDTVAQISHRSRDIVHEPVTGKQATFGGDAKIARACSARVRTVSPSVNLFHRIAHVLKRVALVGQYLSLELLATRHHLFEHRMQVLLAHLPTPCR
jgi:hypothetical protein